MSNEKHPLRFPRFGQVQCFPNRFLREQRTAHPDSAQSLRVRGEEELQSRVRHGLHRHQVFGFFSFCVGVDVHLAHVEAEEDEDRRGGHPFVGTVDAFLDFFAGEFVVLEVALEFDCHRVGEFLFDGWSRHYAESPRLTVVGGGGEGCSVENVVDNRIRHRVRFEAADRAAGTQKVVEVNRVGRIELV